MRPHGWLGYLIAMTTTVAAGAFACTTTLDLNGSDDPSTDDGCELQLSTPVLDFGDVPPGEPRSAPFSLTNPNGRRLMLSSAITGPYLVEGLGDVIEAHATLTGTVALRPGGTEQLKNNDPVTGSLTVTAERCTSAMTLKARVSTDPYLFSGDLAFDVPCGEAKTDQAVSFRTAEPDALMWNATGLTSPLRLKGPASGTIGGPEPTVVTLGVLIDATNSLTPIAQKLTVTIDGARAPHAFNIKAQPRGGWITLTPKVLPLRAGEATVTARNDGNAAVSLSVKLDSVSSIWTVTPVMISNLAAGAETTIKVLTIPNGELTGVPSATLQVSSPIGATPLCGADTVSITAR